MTDTANHQRSSFSPEEIASINRAYENALSTLVLEDSRQDARVWLAKIIMQLARDGETDEGRLSALALMQTLGRKPDGLMVYTGL